MFVGLTFPFIAERYLRNLQTTEVYLYHIRNPFPVFYITLLKNITKKRQETCKKKLQKSRIIITFVSNKNYNTVCQILLQTE